MKLIFLLSLVLFTITVGSATNEDDGDAFKQAAGYTACPDSVDDSKPLPECVSNICNRDGKSRCPGAEDLNPKKSNSTACGYGMRKIEGGKWVGTEISGRNSKMATGLAFLRLTRYMNRKKLDFKVPTITKHHFDKDGNRIASMHFYLGDQEAPDPTNDAVTIEEWGEEVVYYRAFSGEVLKMSVDDWKKEFKTLKDALESSGEAKNFESGFGIAAAFTSRKDPKKRLEVMVLQKKTD